MQTHISAQDCPVRLCLLGNALFSTMSGVVLLLTPTTAAALLGPGIAKAWLVGLAIGLLGFAAMLVLNIRRPSVNLTEARVTTLLDFVWVAGSIAALSFLDDRVLAPAGRWLIGVIALVVLIFALMQVVGLRLAARGASCGVAAAE